MVNYGLECERMGQRWDFEGRGAGDRGRGRGIGLLLGFGGVLDRPQRHSQTLTV